MRVLLLLRGSAGCGKSTWIEQNGLKPYAISADDIRLLHAAPSLDADGNMRVDNSKDSVVWKTIFQILEARMQNGEFTVIDATNSKTTEMKRYKELCERYRYRIYCADFTDVPIEEAKRRNKLRPKIKWVPESAIDNMYARFQTQKIPSGITVIKPDELSRIWYKPLDVSEYKAINIIGDIHGCYTALSKIGDVTKKPDELFVFCGDYIDRGLENAEVIKELLRIYKEPNVCLLEGNHERHLWAWANGGVSKSKEFEMRTRAQLENDNIDKKEVRKLYRALAQCAYYTYHGKTLLITHGGLSALPENLTLVSTEQMIKGAGSYKDDNVADMAFDKNTNSNTYQIHGHRNMKRVPVSASERCFNLEGDVEAGGCLRTVCFCDSHIFTNEIPNDIFRKPEDGIQYENKSQSKRENVSDLILKLRTNPYIVEKQFGNISSFNFSKKAFFDKIWDEQTVKARGLYINIPKGKIVARGYEKFFNINERPETKLDIIQNKLKFPVTAYVKENGFLGLVSYNDEDDSLFVTTKSNPEGDYARWFKDMLYQLPKETLESIRSICIENRVTFVFECVDMKNDPHIIEYPENRLVLLDIICNEIKFSKYDYDMLKSTADNLGLECKERAYTIESWGDFVDWYYTVVGDDYKYHGHNIEGFVIEDANGYMLKLKLAYYNFWKYMRSISHEAIRKGYIDGRKMSSLTTPLANQYYAWVKTLHGTVDIDSIPKDICALRRMFYKSEQGKIFVEEEEN